MTHGFRVRQLGQLALAANALRPVPGAAAGVPAFFGGWLTGELAPHLLGVAALDAGVHFVRHGVRSRRDVIDLVVAGANVAAYSALIGGGRRAAGEIEDALVETLGAGYREVIARDPMPDDVAAPWQTLAFPFRARDVNVTRVRRMSYAPGGRRFELDVWHHRETPAGAPVLLQVHGGAWMLGNKDQQGIPLMLHMAARRWVCASVNYPLSPRARWPEHLVALKQAMRWIREHGHEYGADPAFVAVTGGSAGGHLAAMVALTADDKSLQPGFEDVDTSVQACVPHYGVYDFTDESGASFTRHRLNGLLRPYVMGRAAIYPDDYRAASPLFRITPDAPPFLVLHGRNDTLVPVAEARAFVARLRDTVKNPVAYAELGGAQHAFDLFLSLRSTAVLRGVARFLEWCHATRESRPLAS
ncbi:MAG TPA: alpha/beta hydrolase [Jatrophihabitans sp.]|nr:alpha/beta hydrolase [Jatrophihabitans sp.]